MTPKFRLLSIFLDHIAKKNVGIHRLFIRYLRPTTALCADEQSDTHVIYCSCTRKVCVEGMVSLNAHTGIYIPAYPWHQTPQCLWHTIESGNFR